MNVGINVNSNKLIYNDIDYHVVDLFEYIYVNDTDDMVEQIDRLVKNYNLSKTNTEGFLKLREYYNKENRNPIVFYALICHAFNYQIRFNKNDEYNMPFGKDRSSFNPSLREKFIAFSNALHKKQVTFSNKNLTDFDFSILCSNDFVYVDPPYLNSVAAYNTTWSENDEKCLLDTLDKLNSSGVKFALSNNLKYKNELLDDWKNKYNTHYLEADYSNCNYHKIDRSKDIEILVTNY